MQILGQDSAQINIKRLKSQDVELNIFYDVGANNGSWTVGAQNIFSNAKFELFEPLYGRFGTIESNSLVKDKTYAKMMNLNSNRHQIKSASRPRQYWLLLKNNPV
jgi:hypothetical protein